MATKRTTKAKAADTVVETLVVKAPETITQGSLLDYSKITDKELLNATSQLETYTAQGMETARAYQRQIALVLYNIDSKKLYKKDNFKNIVDYANTVRFITKERSKQAVYQSVFAGKVYSDNTLPQTIKDMTPSNLNILKAALEDEAKKALIIKDAESGVDFASMTQKEVTDYRNTINQKVTPKSEIVEVYTIMSFDEWNEYKKKPLSNELMYDTIEGLDAKYHPDNDANEWITLKREAFNVMGNKKALGYIERRLSITDNIYILYLYIPKTVITHVNGYVTTQKSTYTLEEQNKTEFLLNAGYPYDKPDDILKYVTYAPIENVKSVLNRIIDTNKAIYNSAIEQALITRGIIEQSV